MVLVQGEGGSGQVPDDARGLKTRDLGHHPPERLALPVTVEAMAVGAAAAGGAGLHGAPLAAPAAGVGFVGIVVSVRIPALDVGEVEQDLVVGRAVVPDLIVAAVQVAVHAGTVEVAGHVDEGHGREIAFELVHGVQIDVDAFLGVVRATAAPGPHDEVRLRVGSQPVPGLAFPDQAAHVPQVAGDFADVRRGVQRPVLVGQHADAGDDLAAVGGVAVEDPERVPNGVEGGWCQVIEG